MEPIEPLNANIAAASEMHEALKTLNQKFGAHMIGILLMPSGGQDGRFEILTIATSTFGTGEHGNQPIFDDLVSAFRQHAGIAPAVPPATTTH